MTGNPFFNQTTHRSQSLQNLKGHSTGEGPIISRQRVPPPITFPSGATLDELTSQAELYVVSKGFCAEFVNEKDRRRILGLKLPGDLVNIEATFGIHPGYQTSALGEAEIVNIGDLSNWPRAHGLLTERLTIQVARALSIAKLWTFRLSALDAPQRIAHLLCEVRRRLVTSGRVAHVLRTPLTQSDIADMCGITPIHANRALARLRENGLGEMRRGDFYAKDWSALEQYSQFDPAALPAPLAS